MRTLSSASLVSWALVAAACQAVPPEAPPTALAPHEAGEEATPAPTITPLTGDEEPVEAVVVSAPRGPSLTVAEIKARGPHIHCVPEPPGTVAKLGTIADTPWVVERVARAEAPCEYDVRLRDHEDRIETLPLEPGAYYFAMGREVGGQTVLLLTHIDHGEFQPDGDSKLSTTDVDPTIIGLTRQGTEWSGVSVVVDLEEAVWASALNEDLEMIYLRDSLVEHMLFIQEGRPDTDGLYRAQLEVFPSGEITATHTERIADYVIPRGPQQ